MNKQEAALNPEAADKWVAEQVGNKLLAEEPPVETEFVANKPRAAFLGMANELRDEYSNDCIRNEKRSRQIWESV